MDLASGRIPRVFIMLAIVALAAPVTAAEPATPAKREGSKLKGRNKKPPARPAEDAKDKAFQERYAALVKQHDAGPIKIEMAPADDPSDLPMAMGGQGVVLVANNRRGIYTPPLLSSEDILAVVNEQMATIRKCYKQQLAEDPEWSDDVILDLSVKKTGRISEVSLSPSRLKRYPIGKCLLAEVPKWKFPQFTGELEDGITQEVVNASFPFSFSSRSR